jgi:esterase/lipase
MKKFLKWLLIIIVILTIVYFLGPRPATPKYNTALPAVPATAQLDNFLKVHEAAFPVKPENEARVVWANDSVKQKTPCSIIYLHGFSASQEEADPVHTDMAKKFGCNLLLTRLYAHGLADTVHALEDFTVDQFWESCKEAYSIGKQLGDKVIIMSTSTGGTAALKMAAEYPEIAGLILMSPNIAINDPNAWMLNNHWGKQIAQLVKGGSILKASREDSLYKKYWYHRYRVEGAVQLEELIESSMVRSTFEKVKQPLLLLYYYQDEAHQDPVVKVSAMKKMFEQVATPAAQKQQFALATPGNHVLGSYVVSKDTKIVEEKIAAFLSGVMGLKEQ